MAADATPYDYPNQTILLNSLRSCFERRFERTGSIDDLNLYLSSYINGWNCYNAPPSIYEFIQDNTFIHVAHKVNKWFLDHGIKQLKDWPPYSLDLNPIEHIWCALKTQCYEMVPKVAADNSESEHSRQRLESCLQAAWDTLDQNLFDKLSASMNDRIEAVIEAKGWHTKY